MSDSRQRSLRSSRQWIFYSSCQHDERLAPMPVVALPLFPPPRLVHAPMVLGPYKEPSNPTCCGGLQRSWQERASRLGIAISHENSLSLQVYPKEWLLTMTFP